MHWMEVVALIVVLNIQTGDLFQREAMGTKLTTYLLHAELNELSSSISQPKFILLLTVIALFTDLFTNVLPVSLNSNISFFLNFILTVFNVQDSIKCGASRK